VVHQEHYNIKILVSNLLHQLNFVTQLRHYIAKL